MLSAAVKELQAAKKEITAKIQGLAAEAKKIENAIKALAGLSVGGGPGAGKGRYKRTAAQRAAMAKAQKARWAKKKSGKGKGAKPAKKQKKMSRLGKLRIKLGALNRYGKKAEATKVQAQITKLEAKAAKK